MEAFAPWAEPVLMTADELLRLPDNGSRYELVAGRLVRMSPSGFKHGVIALALGSMIRDFVREHALGVVAGAETGFVLSPPGEPDTVLAPDVAFVRAGRGPELSSVEGESFLRLAPDLVVEVASPSQGRAEMAAKAALWLRAGVRLVWVVLPREEVVEVFAHGQKGRDVPFAGMLSGEDVLPGFACTPADLLS